MSRGTRHAPRAARRHRVLALSLAGFSLFAAGSPVARAAARWLD